MNEDYDVLADDFSDYRQVARETFRTPPTAAVFAAAHRRTVRRRVAAAIAVAGAVVLALTGTAVLQSFSASRPTPGDPSSVSPSPTPPPSSSTGPAADVEVGNRVRFLDQEMTQTLRSMTITLPAWPGAAAGMCRSGRHTFRDGTASTGGGGEAWEYRILHKGLRGIFVNVDGEPGDEILAQLGCGRAVAGELSFELLALKVGGGGLRALGYVTGADVPGFDRFFPDGDDLVVEVQEADMVASVEQRRRYRYDGTRFVQVGGPTSFPDEIPADLAWIRVGATGDTSDAHTRCGSGGMLSFVDGRSGVWEYREGGNVIASAEFTLGSISRGALDEPIGAEQADTLVTLTCRAGERTDQWVHRVDGEPVVAVGVDGVTGIVSHRITGGLAEVTVETTGGQEVRTYRSNGVSFTRES